jgi:hypothetical protein
LGKKSNLPEYFDDEFFVMGHASSEVIDHDCGRGSQGQWQLLSTAPGGASSSELNLGSP